MADGGFDVPGAGHVSKKEALLFGGLAVIVIGIALYRHRKNQQATATAAASAGNTATDPNLDPATGFDYGTPSDTAALAAQSGAYYGGGYGGGGGGGVPQNTVTAVTSNAQWAQNVEDYLVNTVQANGTVVAAAIGKYLTGQPLTSDQVSIVEQGIAFEGQPPQAGSNGYPPSFHTASASPPSQGGSLPTLKTGIEIHVPYNVQPGALPAVAQKFGISVAHILSLSENAGKTGRETTMQVYYIPYRTAPTDTLAIVAQKFGISPEHLALYIPQ